MQLNLPDESSLPPVTRSDDSFPIESQNDLFSATNEVGNWVSLCTNLGVNDAIMNRLKYSTREDILKKHECLTNYFRNSQPRWNDVVMVVAESPIDNISLACKIAKKYMLIDKKTCISLYGRRDEL